MGGRAMSSLPPFVEEGLLKVCKASETSWDEVHRDYLDLFNDPFIQGDDQFKTDEERHLYAVAVLHSRYVARPPMKTVTLVPVGYTGRRIARSSGQPNCTISVVVKGDRKIKRVICRGELLSDLYRSINLFHQYDVKLGEFKEGGDLIADNRSKFENPIKLKIQPAQMMEQLGVKRVSIKDAAKFPSAQRKGQRKGSSYIDRSDWRVVRGIIVRDFRGTRDDETTYGAYTIADATVQGEPIVLDDGTIIRPGFTVWTDPAHMVYAVEDEVDCYGPISVNKDGEAQMTALLILPVHTRGGRGR